MSTKRYPLDYYDYTLNRTFHIEGEVSVTPDYYNNELTATANLNVTNLGDPITFSSGQIWGVLIAGFLSDNYGDQVRTYFAQPNLSDGDIIQTNQTITFNGTGTIPLNDVGGIYYPSLFVYVLTQIATDGIIEYPDENRTFVETNSCKIKIYDVWKPASVWMKINGAWKRVQQYIKINGAWKQR